MFRSILTILGDPVRLVETLAVLGVSSMGWDGCAVAGACAVGPGQSWVQLHHRRKRSFRLFAAEGAHC